MKRMSSGYELQGRTAQKARTRAALVQAAHELLAEGIEPTVEQAAERAGVSVATAYRYFPNRRELLVAAYPAIGTETLLALDAPADAAARLELVTEELGRQLLAHETAHRTALRLHLESRDAPVLRQGRAIGWIEDALQPLRDERPAAEVHRLALAIRAAIGIEPLVWLTDVGGLSSKEAVEVMRSSARTLLRAALD